MTDCTSIVAALSVVRPHTLTDTTQDQRRIASQHLHVDEDDFAALDSLAASCLHGTSDSYAVTVISRPLTLVIAGKDCSDANGLEEHIRVIWQFLCAAASDKNLYGATVLNLEAEIWKYSWTAIYTCWTTNSELLEQAIEKVFSEEEIPGVVFNDADLAFANDVTGRLAIIRARLQSTEYNDTNVSPFKTALAELWSLVNPGFRDRQQEKVLAAYVPKRVEWRSAIPVRAILRKLLFPIEAMEGLRDFLTSATFAAWRQRTLNIRVLSRGATTVTMDFDNSPVRQTVLGFQYPETGIDLDKEWSVIVQRVTQNSQKDVSTGNLVIETNAHAECILLAYLRNNDLDKRSGTYIGTSEQPCFACWTLFAAYNEGRLPSARAYLRGLHAHVPREWTILDGLEDTNHRVLRWFEAALKLRILCSRRA